MAVKLRRSRRALMEELRYEPTEKHVRAALGGRTVADTKRAVLVWEPRRVLPCYAVPADDLDAELSVAHPRDPYHRVDIRRSSRHVRMELDGELLAESSRPHLVFETGLPVRFYLPREDIRVAIEPTE